MMKISDKIQDFSLESTLGKEVFLSDYREKKVVLYFYPKDNTPGWTTEASEFRDLKEEFEKMGYMILGISKDSMKSHIKFAQKLNLNFQLLSDPEKKVHEMFDVLKEKNMFGKIVIGTERSTFIIDENGILIKEYRKVKAKGHAKQILEYIKELSIWNIWNVYL